MFRDLLRATPLMERGKPLVEEMFRMLQEQPLTNQLPAYCYRIMEVLRRTYFRAFPALSDIAAITDEAAARGAKTLEATKKVLRLDWGKLGCVFGIAARCIRYAQLEALAEADDLENCSIEESKKIYAAVFGEQWVEANSEQITAKTLDVIIAEQLNRYFAPWIARHVETAPQWDLIAYQWSPQAMADFYKGMGEGMTGFLDENGKCVGESVRAGTYLFLLIVWPEIKAMLESNPKKTLTDLHEWLTPFMRTGFLPDMDLDTLRDVCGPPPGGIGLSLRPLKTRRPKRSA